MRLPDDRRHPRRRILRAWLYAYHATPGRTSYSFMLPGDPLRRIIYTCEWWAPFEHDGYEVRLVDHFIDRGPEAAHERPLLHRLLAAIGDDPEVDLVVTPSRRMFGEDDAAIAVVVDRLEDLGVGVVVVDEEDITGSEARALAA